MTNPSIDSFDEEIPFDDMMPVHEAKLVITVLGEAESAGVFENFIASLSLEDLAREMDDGELIGASAMVGAIEIPPGQVRRHLEAVGNDGSFFEGIPQADAERSLDRAIELVRGDQGWNDDTMARLATDFIMKSGLQAAFLAHLEEQAAEENAFSMDDMTP